MILEDPTSAANQEPQKKSHSCCPSVVGQTNERIDCVTPTCDSLQRTPSVRSCTSWENFKKAMMTTSIYWKIFRINICFWSWPLGSTTQLPVLMISRTIAPELVITNLVCFDERGTFRWLIIFLWSAHLIRLKFITVVTNMRKWEASNAFTQVQFTWIGSFNRQKVTSRLTAFGS